MSVTFMMRIAWSLIVVFCMSAYGSEQEVLRITFPARGLFSSDSQARETIREIAKVTTPAVVDVDAGYDLVDALRANYGDATGVMWPLIRDANAFEDAPPELVKFLR